MHPKTGLRRQLVNRTRVRVQAAERIPVSIDGAQNQPEQPGQIATRHRRDRSGAAPVLQGPNADARDSAPQSEGPGILIGVGGACNPSRDALRGVVPTAWKRAARKLIERRADACPI